MILLLTSVLVFNFIAFKTVKGISKNKIVHIWFFTIAFQLSADVFIDLKYQGYWYFTQGIEWAGLPAYTVLIPPVNILFLNYFPFNRSLIRRIGYIAIWEIFLLTYEMIALLPEPWGFFHYGWWSILHSTFINPILLIIVLGYYKWISKLENEACERGT